MPIDHNLINAGYWATIIVIGAYLTGVVLYLISRMVLGDRYWFIALLNNAALYVLSPLLICLPVALLLQAAPLWTASGLLWLICAGWFAPYFRPRSRRIPTGSTLHAYTFNMWGGNPCQERITQWLRNLDADLVFLQEVPNSFAGSGMRSLRDVYPFQYRQRTSIGWWTNAVLSRHPILTIVNLDDRGGLASTRQRIEISVNDQSIALYCIHLTYTVRKSRVAATWSLLRASASYDDARRNREIDCLLEEVSHEKLPYIVAGDFNMSAQSVTYQRLTRQMHDAFLQAGYGFGGTWPIAEVMNFPAFVLPLMRIDYIWHSDHFRAINAKVGPKLGSDHLPVYAQLEWINES